MNLEELRDYLQSETGEEFTEYRIGETITALEKPVMTENGGKYLVIRISEGSYQITVESNWWDEKKEEYVCREKECVKRLVGRYLLI